MNIPTCIENESNFGPNKCHNIMIIMAKNNCVNIGKISFLVNTLLRSFFISSRDRSLSNPNTFCQYSLLDIVLKNLFIKDAPFIC